MNCKLHDWDGYAKHREEVNAAILGELATDGKTHTELAIKLRSIGIGDAKSDDPMELAYSSTGAILRTAVTALRSAGFIYDSWDVAPSSREYPKPFRFYRWTDLPPAEEPNRTATGAALR